jgi:hypothetical protein
MSCTFGLKITQTDKSFVFIPDNQIFTTGFTAPRVTSPFQVGRLVSVKYSGGSGGAGTDVTVASIATYTGANPLYEVGFMNNMGTMDIVSDNRA